MSTVVFIDATPPKPYDAATLDREPTGGMIATVIHVAEALAAGHEVFVLQKRPPAPATGRARYLPIREDECLRRAELVVWIRGRLAAGPNGVPAVRALNPGCRLLYWSHTTLPQPFLTLRGSLAGLVAGRMYRRLAGLFRRYDVRLLATSRFHAGTVRAAFGPDLPVGWIHNPVPAMEERYGPLDPDPDKILYASTPERGLGLALRLFAEARRARPGFRLFVASPGYRVARLAGIPGVVDLGPLPRRELFRHIRESLCVFYPNLYCQEAFGLVFAESNTLGTPVLTHPVGAAPEVLQDPRQLVDCRDPAAVVARLVAWAGGERPVVRAREAYGVPEVTRLWEDLLVADWPEAFRGERL